MNYRRNNCQCGMRITEWKGKKFGVGARGARPEKLTLTLTLTLSYRKEKPMIVMNVNDKKDQKIDTYPYKGKPYPVKDVWIRWLSQAGPRTRWSTASAISPSAREGKFLSTTIFTTRPCTS